MVQHAQGASEIDPDSVTKAEFSHVFRGYSIDEVRQFLRHVGEELHRLRSELSAARSVQEAISTNNTSSFATVTEPHSDTSTEVRPGTVIDLQSHRLTLERDDLGCEKDPDLPLVDQIDARRTAERHHAFAENFD
ncbi:MAG: DivIVA domain-containing protein, partial [Actinomycetota bacterium]|nr:DivIVA domain-containing protein [Actinomycetota bacterium]